MDPFSNAPGFILDLIFLNLSEEDLHETLRVSKSWFWASIRRIKKLKITLEENPLKSMAKFYNKHCGSPADEIDLFQHLVLDELVVDWDDETTNYLVNNGCNTAVLTIRSCKEALVTLDSLKKFVRLQSFEYCNNMDMEWHPFIIECLKSADFGLDAVNECPIEAIKLNSNAWTTEDPVLRSVTKLSVRNATIDFLRALVDLCLNLEELHCTRGEITEEWHQVFPANIKRIELHDVCLSTAITTIVNASTDSARHLFPYLCQNWESVEKFHYHGEIYLIGQTVYQAFPQKREEIFMCQSSKVNLANPLLQCRKLRVQCHGWHASTLSIPASKHVKFVFHVERNFHFTPRDVCLAPEKVERLSLLLRSWKPVISEHLGPKNFEGFCRLTSLELSHCSTLFIKMVLDQCPSIKKLKLIQVKADTLGNIPVESSYQNVRELVLTHCFEQIEIVFQVFPCLAKFKHSGWRKDVKEWLWRHLIASDKNYGLVFGSSTEIQYMVSDELQSSLNEAQKLLNEYFHSECYLKGFKLLPRVSKQKVIYIS